MITSHYYKNTNNTPIMCDWEYGEDPQEIKDQKELEKLIKDISPKTRTKLIKILKKEIEKEKSKAKKEKESGLIN